MERDYNNGKVYLIRNHVNNMVYVGSTTTALSARMAQHRAKSKTQTTRNIYQAFHSLGMDKFYIELLEPFPCKSREELLARENFHMRGLNSIHHGYNGMFASGRQRDTPEGKVQYLEYYKENRDKIIERKRQYYEGNKDKMHEKQRQYYEENKDKMHEKNRRYQNENRDILNEKKRQKRKENRGTTNAER